MSIIDVNHGHSQSIPRSIPDEPPQVESNFGDSSEPIFSMYTKAAVEEDNKMVERWQKDADGIIIFVSSFLRIHTVLCLDWNIYRPVSSLLPSLHSFPSPSGT